MNDKQINKLIEAVEGVSKRLWWIALWLFFIMCAVCEMVKNEL